jgi:hypothetical protein
MSHNLGLENIIANTCQAMNTIGFTLLNSVSQVKTDADANIKKKASISKNWSK